MSGIINLLGQGRRANKPVSESMAMRAQSSVEGRPRAIGAGQNRYAGNIIWYGDYRSTNKTAGGKGGAFSGKGATGQYTYSASFVVALGERVTQVQAVSNGSEYSFFYDPPDDLVDELEDRGFKVTTRNTFGASFKTGTFAQTAWSYLVTAHPTQALPYHGEALALFPNLGLGSSPALPNFNFEVLWYINTDIAAYGPDANPADWVDSFLSDADWGAGFPSALIDDLTEYRTWARATGLLVSPLLVGQQPANGHLADLMLGTISDFVWSDGVLKVRPYADKSWTGNGYTYTFDNTPVYDLVESDFLQVEHGPSVGDGAIPKIKISRMDPADVKNQIPLEWLDRNNLYNPVTIYNQDDALIVAAGRTRPTDVRQHHFFCKKQAAGRSAALQMRRLKILRKFYFTLPPQFIALEPMDIVTLTESSMGLDEEPVRITFMSEAANGALECEAEEFFGVVDDEPLYEREAPQGNARNVNQEPLNVLTPVLFEPPAELANGLVIYAAVTGQDLTSWGGANVWVATDAAGTYQNIGQIVGASRMGVLTAILPTHAEELRGQTIDTTNTLRVNLTISEAELTSGSSADMTALNTACYVDGEIIAYQTATLTGSYAYDLAPMVRGAYGSTISAHAVGTNFVRLDETLFTIPFTADRVGSTIYVKFQSFNLFGGGTLDLADVPVVAYVIQGTALSSPFEDIQNLRLTFIDNMASINWDEVVDFRNPLYEIRVGDDWDAAVSLGVVAHPPFTVFGDGTYLVKARAEPSPGLIVYSENAASVEVVGSTLPAYVVATWDEPATGWSGTIDGDGAIDGANFVTTADNSIARYTIPAAHIIDVIFDRPTRITCTVKVVGVPVGDDILTNPDFLGDPDILSAASTQYVDGWAEIYAASGDDDIYAVADVYAVPDIYESVSAGSWVKYAPGEYLGHNFSARIAIVSYSADVIAAATVFTFSAHVRARADHIVNYALDAAGETFNFTPDGEATAYPFNGGPNGATYPQVLVAIQNQSDGDYYTVTDLSLSQATIRCFNAGVGVARTVSIVIFGW